MSFEIILANPRGFCAGVERAIAIVEEVLARFPSPIYVRHEVVHNRTVVEGLRQKGAVFIEDLADVPDGAVLIFSAHGVSKAVREEAKKRHFKIFDATCPLVTKVHVEVSKMSQKKKRIIMIGHAGHPEVEGTMGQSEEAEGMVLVEKIEDINALPIASTESVGYVTQTTLSLDDTQTMIQALQKKFPAIEAPKKEDICYATQNRQEAIHALAEECDLILVIGSPNSSNSNRLREVAHKAGCEAYLLDSADDLDPKVVIGKKRIGVSAGASAPELLVQALINRLKSLGGNTVQVRPETFVDEGMHFPLPVSLLQTSSSSH